jgi:release factor glutamine methyltransferase
MRTLGEVLQLSVDYLKNQQVDKPRRIAEEILSYLLGLSRISLYMQFDRPMEEKELTSFRDLLKRKVKGEPLEYLLESIEFFHCKIFVNSSVLIPRQETEILLDRICGILRPLDLKNKIAWDICCGSGCLGIGLKKALPDLRVALSDISIDALHVAKKNSAANEVDVELLQGDLLLPFKSRKADYLLCNPPYISEAEYESLDKSVRSFEPYLSLVGGKDGTEFYQRLSQELPDYLNPKAKVFFEIGYAQGKKIFETFSAPCWRTKYIEKDFSGHDRFFFLEFE